MLEGELVLVGFGHTPGIAIVKQNSEHAGLKDSYFCVSLQLGVLLRLMLLLWLYQVLL